MSNLRLAIIGLGSMGATHANNVVAGKIPGAELTAVCDSRPDVLAAFAPAKPFTDYRALLKAGVADAVLIATPHFQHTAIGIAALEAGLHVLVEKPISVHKADCDRLLAAYRGREDRQVFAAMFNQRTLPVHQKLKAMLTAGEIGDVFRAQWTITNWFRTDAYYASAGWRATWAHEGGGVLLNQCPHNLDLFWWFLGDARAVRAHCHFGRHHRIEVEDEVTAYLELESGATGVFIASTGEAPGTNRLEIAGNRGRLILEDDKLSFLRTAVPVREFQRTSPERFGKPAVEPVAIEVALGADQHNAIIRNFVSAIRDGAPLIAPAVEGVHSVELANAMLLSTWLDRTITLPVDGALYEAELQKRIAASPRTSA